MWHFLAFHYCVGHCIRVFGDRSIGGSLIGVMCAPLHVHVVLLCSAYRACSFSLRFKAPHPTPLFIIIFLCSLIIIYSFSFPLFFQFSVTGAGAGGGTGFFWWAGLVACLQVGRGLGCLGLGSVVPVPYVPGHPTSICD